jgi:putative transposase
VYRATYKSLKVEFVYQYTFETLQQLDLELFDYVNWWNQHIRAHYQGFAAPISGYGNQPVSRSQVYRATEGGQGQSE